MKKLALAGLALFVAAVAYAASDVDPWVSVNEQKDFKRPVRFRREMDAIFVDAGALAVNGISLTPSGRGTLVYDFPALTSLTATLDTVCAESSAGTATGCAFGDGVLLGVDQVLPNAFGTVEAYVSAANAFKVRACATGITDAGTFNIPDASYTVTCIR